MNSRYASVMDRLSSFICPEPNTGCWLWTGGTNSTGYGSITVRNKKYSAHKLAYETIVGKVPDGMDLDHLCRVRSCVNPAHLEPVSRSVNCLRGLTGEAAGSIKRAVSQCPKGHPYDAENTRISTYGNRKPFRVCRACARDRANLAYRSKKRSA